VIVVTRAREQAGSFAALLEDGGARVMLAPAIEIEPPSSWEPLDAALARAGQYRWAIFTSVNGVAMARRRLEISGRGADALGACQIAAIGPATAQALVAWGLSVSVVPGEYVAEGLADSLRPLIDPGDRILLPRAAETRDALVRALAEMGAVVDEVAAYRTRAAAGEVANLQQALERRAVDAVTFTSSSTVRHFAAVFEPEQLAALMSPVTVACIGPITRNAAAAFGLTTHVMPTEYTIPALADAIVAHFDRARS
jgi:uroporphyrinogen III methyltransferase/synthase